LDKAVEIKRRAQRCVQNGDLDGALSEYEKLVAGDETDPYNYVLLADLLYKKGDQGGAADRYLSAAEAYEVHGLYKNGIAVCKKMLRLSLAPGRVLKQLATLHAKDGLGAEAALYFMQYAEHQVRGDKHGEAADALRKAFEAAPDTVKALERLAEVLLLADDRPGAAHALADAAAYYGRNGQLQAAEQCKKRARDIDAQAFEKASIEGLSAGGSLPPAAGAAPEPGMRDADVGPPGRNGQASPAADPEDAESDTPPESAGGRGIQTIESAWTGEPAGEPPGLRFDAPDAAASPPAPSRLSEVEKILGDAQEAFRGGDRERAGQMLARAAEAYEAAGQFDQAATILRSLAKSAQAPPQILERWLENCRRRDDGSEAAHVACELGDRALAANRVDEARGWFERAIAFDPGNELAVRRLQRLTGAAPAEAKLDAPGAAVAEPAGRETAGTAEPVPQHEGDAEPVAKPPSSGVEPGRVDVAVGRGEAVTFDLGSLISEFQRGVDAQLSGDAQSHYDLAMAYREMGLLEQAVDSFRIAGRDTAFADRCAEMIGRCLLDQGRFEDASVEFSTALQSGRLDVETEVNLRYQLGLSHEAAGRIPEALTEFEGVYAAQPNYPDVALKIRVLRKSLENI
jgi:tetratricopeptide (TPR) repeat protein